MVRTRLEGDDERDLEPKNPTVRSRLEILGFTDQRYWQGKSVLEKLRREFG